MLALLVPAALWAQGEGITLEGLANTVSANTDTILVLTQQIGSLAGRVDAIEGGMAATPAAIATESAPEEGEACELALRGRINIFSLQSYMETWPDSALPRRFEVVSVWRVPVDGVSVTFEAFWNADGGNTLYGNRYVTESWKGCEFLGAVWTDEFKP